MELPKNIHSRFIKNTIQFPQRTAICVGSHSLTYHQLACYASSIARQLDSLQPDQTGPIAVVIENSVEQVAALIAVALAKRIFVPIEPDMPAERMETILRESQAACILTTSELAADLQPFGLTLFRVDTVNPTTDQPLQLFDDLPEVDPVKPAYIIYTSGTTGKPKGVVISHQAVVNTLEDINHRFSITAQDSVLSLSALSFDLSIYDIFGLLSAGGTVYRISPRKRRDIFEWDRLITHHSITVWNTVPTYMEMYLTLQRSKKNVTSPLKTVLLSGDVVRPALVKDLKSLFPNARLVALGGATEAAIWSIYFPLEELSDTDARIPYGRPLYGQNVQVLDTSLERCATGETGEIFISGAGLADGYCNDPILSCQKFIIHPKTLERLYHTGDLGCYNPNGDIEIHGRMDTQVKFRGYRIELGEIESTCASIENIQGAVAHLCKGSKGAESLALFVIPTTMTGDDNHSGLKADIQQRMAARLPAYMRPEKIYFLRKFPLSDNGKIDRNALLKLPSVFEAIERNNITPFILSEFSFIFNTSDITMESNFVELGGDSVAAVQLVVAIKLRYDIELDIESFMQEPLAEKVIWMLGEALASGTDIGEPRHSATSPCILKAV